MWKLASQGPALKKKAPANTESSANPRLRVDLRLASHPSKEGVGQYLISGRSR